MSAVPEGITSADVIVWGEGGTFAQQIAAGRHRLKGDEPDSVGGTDTGPSPYDFLLAALGSCTSMTVAMYARKKNWPLERVTVWLRHSKIYAVDCAECEPTEGMLDRIERDVRFEGPLTAEQRSRLLEIANKCPVHRTLTSGINIRTKIMSFPGWLLTPILLSHVQVDYPCVFDILRSLNRRKLATAEFRSNDFRVANVIPRPNLD